MSTSSIPVPSSPVASSTRPRLTLPAAVITRTPAARTAARPPHTLPRLVAALILIALPPTLLFLIPPLHQAQSYHAFVDQRAWLGLPNTLDVLTNLPLLLAGLFGLREALHQPATPHRATWLVFFGALALVGFGSGWYHLAPNDTSIVWDRLPLSLMFTSLFAAVLGETVSPSLGRRVLLPVLAFGVFSVVWWQGLDDLRPYFAAQSLALVGVPALLALFPKRGDGRSWLVAGLGCYALAVAAEHSDRFIFDLTGHLFSGHSLKHCLAALGCATVAVMLRARRTPHKIS